MTLPRFIVPGQVTMAQKRTYRGEHRLRPDSATNAQVLYALAYAAHNNLISLSEFQFLSNHHHTLCTDPDGDRPAFFQQLHSLIARSVNRQFGDRDNLWSTQRYSAPVLLDAESILEKTVYVMLNAVHHGLVRYPWDWGGVSSWHMEYGVPIVVPKPPGFFSDDMPDQIELVLERPPGLLPGLSDKEARARVRSLAKAKAAEIVRARRLRGQSPIGMKRVSRRSRRTAPDYAKLKAGRRAQIRPEVATKDTSRRIAALVELKCFRAEHERARLELKRGALEVQFPAGTYKMRKLGLRSQPP